MEAKKNKKEDFTRKERIEELIKIMSKDLYEREEVIALSLLVSLTEQSLFFLGPPGTGKSLIARRIVSAFNEVSHFENLMQKFTTPEEVFGPVSIKELKNDNYKRKTEGYLPTSNFAFLDEIWKSSPAVLNTLLTIINERLFKNGSLEEKVPLKTVVAASNETPPKGQGLEALYDRFVARMYVAPIEERNNFEKLLDKSSIERFVKIPNHLKVSAKEWMIWRKEMEEVKMSKETLAVINAIRIKLSEQEGTEIYVSDRRWQKIALLIKASAYFCNRDETNLIDTLILRHCLWVNRDDIELVDKIVKEAIKENSYSFDGQLRKFDELKDKLDKEINDELYYTEDIYKVERLKDDKEYFKTTRSYNSYNRRHDSTEIYISKKYMGSDVEFSPVDVNGNEINHIRCNFNSTKSCKIEFDYYYDYGYRDEEWKKLQLFTPKILIHKGDEKENINPRLINDLISQSTNLIEKVGEFIGQVKKYIAKVKSEQDSPFIPKKLLDIPVESANELLSNLELRKKDSERLKSAAGEEKVEIHTFDSLKIAPDVLS